MAAAPAREARADAVVIKDLPRDPTSELHFGPEFFPQNRLKHYSREKATLRDLPLVDLGELFVRLP